jgi:hypothetical protein
MIDIEQVIEIFNNYNEYNKERITRAMFEESLFDKEKHPGFMSDMSVLFAPDANWDPKAALQLVRETVMPKLKGQAWKREKA